MLVLELDQTLIDSSLIYGTSEDDLRRRTNSNSISKRYLYRSQRLHH